LGFSREDFDTYWTDTGSRALRD